MKKVAVLILLIVVLGGLAVAQDTGGKLGKHDVSDGGQYLGCKGCHVPHAALSEYRLWGRALPTTVPAGGLNEESQDYTTGTAISASNAAFHTAACMSCHDGTTATSIVGTGNWAVGSDDEGLKNDHPTHAKNGNNSYNITPTAHLDSNNNVDYGTSAAYTGSGIQPIASQARWYPAIAVPVAKSDWYVECSSCHDPHNGAGYKFVRGTSATTTQNQQIANLALCRNCHGR